MLRPFKTVFIGLLVLIKNKLVDPNKAYIFHQTLLSLGLIVPHGHVWWQEGKGEQRLPGRPHGLFLEAVANQVGEAQQNQSLNGLFRLAWLRHPD